MMMIVWCCGGWNKRSCSPVRPARITEGDCRPTGHDTGGVAGIKLGRDRVVNLVLREPDSELLTICANGCGKRSPFDDYSSDGGKGVININTERNGDVVASLAVRDDDQIMLMSRGGMVVRTMVTDIRVMGRAATGVRVINLADDDALTGVARCERTSPKDSPALEPKRPEGDASESDGADQGADEDEPSSPG